MNQYETTFPDRDMVAPVLQYCFDGNGFSRKWESRRDSVEPTLDAINEESETLRCQVLDGTLSPLAYHAHTHIFDIGTLAAYTGIAKNTVKKHFRPDKFSKLDDATLQRYADVLEMTIDELKNI